MSVEAITWAYKTTVGSSAAKAVLLVLANYADENESAYPGIPRIAKMTELSERTVQRAVAELEEAGVITVERNINKTNRYRLDLSWRGGDTVTPPGDTVTPGGDTVASDTKETHKGTRNTPVARRATPTPRAYVGKKSGLRATYDDGGELEAQGRLDDDTPPAPTDLRTFRRKRALTPTYLGEVWDTKAEMADIPKQERGATGGLVRNIKTWVQAGAKPEDVLKAMDLFFLAPEQHHRGGRRAWLSFVDHWPALHAKVTAPDITSQDYYTEHREQKTWTSAEEYREWAKAQAKAGARV